MTNCPSGFFCPQSNLINPFPCPEKYFCPESNLINPFPCEAGYYCPQELLTKPIKCPEKYFCPSRRIKTPIICPENSYCQQGSVGPTPCRPLFSSQEGSIQCIATPGLYGLISSIILIVLVVVGIFLYYKFRNEDTSMNIPSKTKLEIERNSLLSHESISYDGT